jgi:hypothetical protein
MRLGNKKIERAFENSCQNAKQRDRPAASLSTPNKLADFTKHHIPPLKPNPD